MEIPKNNISLSSVSNNSNSLKDAKQSSMNKDLVKPSIDFAKPNDKNLSEFVKNDMEKQLRNAKLMKEVTQNRSTFSLFKLQDGVLYTRVRNLDTGEVKYFPNLEVHDFFDMINNKGSGAVLDLRG